MEKEKTQSSKLKATANGIISIVISINEKPTAVKIAVYIGKNFKILKEIPI
ncbi:hypothetical protein [Caminibacter pacificus]|uniref:hypothetical protein n=1 Tax=Caminibacter pacificus TaxID=1424653 RepID=UPI0014751959|nr:hypothetical protein [Caminibacter pacificus]